MTRAEFIRNLACALEADPNQLSPNTVLCDLPQWDSMRLLEVIVLLDKELGVKLNANLLTKCETAGELLALIGDRLSE